MEQLEKNNITFNKRVNVYWLTKDAITALWWNRKSMRWKNEIV